MISLKNVTITLKNKERVLLENFSYSFLPGEKVAIIGAEGIGKSTFLQALHDIHSIDLYSEIRGHISTKGLCAYLPQSLPDYYLDLSVQDYLGEYYVPAFAYISKHFPSMTSALDAKRQMRSLSGGERVKVQLVRIHLQDPDIILLDEPTNDLDLSTIQWLEQYIKASRHLIVFVSHDEALVNACADIIVHIEYVVARNQSKVTISRESYSQYFARRSETIRHNNQIARKERSDYQQQMDKWRQIYNRVDHEQRVITRQDPATARLLKKKMKSVKALERRLQRETDDFHDFMEEDISISAFFDESATLPNGKRVIDVYFPTLQIGDKILSEEIRLYLPGNEHIAIIGDNGVGKTTLLKVLYAELSNRKGIIPFYMPQDYFDAIDPLISAQDYLIGENVTKERITRVRSMLGSMHFTREDMVSQTRTLSKGQLVKLMFIDMIEKKANVLLLDEPTRNLCPTSNLMVREALRGFRGAVICASHDRTFISDVCSRIYALTPRGLMEYSEIS